MLGSVRFQPKLRIGPAGDIFEQEGDRVARSVVARSYGGAGERAGLLHAAPGGVVQRKCARCEEEEEETLRRSPKDGADTTTAATATPPPAEQGMPEPTAEKGAGATLLVADEAEQVGPGQMRKSEFLATLRESVCAAANEAMASTGQTTENCPWMEHWFSRAADKDAGYVEKAIRKFAPETAGASTAQDYIPLVSARVRRSVEQWAKTGEISGLPEGVTPDIPGLGVLGGLAAGLGGMFFKAKAGGPRGVSDVHAIRYRLGTGRSLPGGVRSRMESAFGLSFAKVRIHTESGAAALSDQLNARAFTVGEHVAFGLGEYQPGTLVGDALLAHELAHVVQQGGAAEAAGVQSASCKAGESPIEQDADAAAASATASLWTAWGHQAGEITTHSVPRLRSGLQLSRCTKQAQVKSPQAQKAVEEAKAEGCKIDPAAEKLKQGLIATFGLADVKQEGKACWTAAELTKMRDALAKVPADQRGAIQGVTLLRVQASSCKSGDPSGCFREGISAQTGARSDVIEIADVAFSPDVEIEDKLSGTKVTRTGMSGKKIEALPSQETLLHEVGHAVETAPRRASQSARVVADVGASKAQDALIAIVEEISRAPVPTFRFTFSSNPAEAAYQTALKKASGDLNAMVRAIGDPSNATAAEIKKLAAGFGAAIKTARSSVADLKKKRGKLPLGSGVAMDEVEAAMDATLAAGERLLPAFEARLAAQQKLEPAERAETAAGARIVFGPKGSRTELDISRRLAELVALVELKGIDIKKSVLGDYPKENWPDRPGELFADLYQTSLTDAEGLEAFDGDIAAFFRSPIGPKGAWKDRVDKWIREHTRAEKK